MKTKSLKDMPARKLCKYIQKLEKECNMSSYEVYGMIELAKQSFQEEHLAWTKGKKHN